MITVLLSTLLPLVYALGVPVAYRRQWAANETAKRRGEARPWHRTSQMHLSFCLEASRFGTESCQRGGPLTSSTGWKGGCGGVAERHCQSCPEGCGDLAHCWLNTRHQVKPSYVAPAWPAAAIWTVGRGIASMVWRKALRRPSAAFASGWNSFLHPEIKIPDYDKIKTLEKEPNHGP